MQRLMRTLVTGVTAGLIFTAGSGYSAPLYQGNDHRVMDHIKTKPVTIMQRSDLIPAHREKSYGPESITGMSNPEAGPESINQLPPTSAGQRSALFKSSKNYGIRSR